MTYFSSAVTLNCLLLLAGQISGINNNNNNNNTPSLIPINALSIRNCERVTCLRKCCPENHSLNFGQNIRCVETAEEQFRTALNAIKFYDTTVKEYAASEITEILLYVENCNHPMDPYDLPIDRTYNPMDPGNDDFYQFRLSKNGGRLLPNRTKEEIQIYYYCVDVIGNDESLIYLKCPMPVTDVWYPISMAVSIPFLLISFLIYIFVGRLRKVQYKNMTCYLIALMIAYGLLIVRSYEQTKSVFKQFCEHHLIYVLFVQQFFMLAVYFWFNVMCFDHWCEISECQLFTGSSKKVNKKKFTLYSTYAWICPIMITSYTLYKFKKPMEMELFKTGTVEEIYWFEGNLAIEYRNPTVNPQPNWTIHFFGSMTVLFMLNAAIFLGATRLILMNRKNSMNRTQNGPKHHSSEKQQAKCVVHFKLFAVLYMKWAAQVISWLGQNQFFQYIIYIIYIANAVHGPTIFILFGLPLLLDTSRRRKRKARRKRRHRDNNGDSNANNATQLTIRI